MCFCSHCFFHKFFETITALVKVCIYINALTHCAVERNWSLGASVSRSTSDRNANCFWEMTQGWASNKEGWVKNWRNWMSFDLLLLSLLSNKYRRKYSLKSGKDLSGFDFLYHSHPLPVSNDDIERFPLLKLSIDQLLNFNIHLTKYKNICCYRITNIIITFVALS